MSQTVVHYHIIYQLKIVDWILPDYPSEIKMFVIIQNVFRKLTEAKPLHSYRE